MISVYADTAFICSAIARDSNSDRAVARMNLLKGALPWTWLHELEFRNAVRLQVFQSRIDEQTRDRILQICEEDKKAGVFEPVSPSLRELSSEAERLSASYSEQIGTRSLDILHVAFAAVLRAEEFLTFDKRQSDLAKATGLRVPEL